MKIQWQGFQSSMKVHIISFLKHKRALGCRYDNEDKALRLFDRFLVQQGISDPHEVTSTMVDSFLVSRVRKSARSFNHILGVIRRLFGWLVLQGYLNQSPVMMKPRRETFRLIPFIFSASQIIRLLNLALALPDNPRAPMRGPSYHSIFTLLACLGLRVGEVSRLRWGDIQFGDAILEIKDTKFRKSRLVPFGPKIAHCLLQYRQHRMALGGEVAVEAPVFSFTPGYPVNPATVSITFQALIRHLQLTIPPGTRRPTVHCLRHSFAVRTLLHWYQSGLDPESRLLHLSTFLGHVNVSSTAVYLTITEELLSEASQRFERLAMSHSKETV